MHLTSLYRSDLKFSNIFSVKNTGYDGKFVYIPMNVFVFSQTFSKLGIIFKVSDLEVGGLLNVMHYFQNNLFLVETEPNTMNIIWCSFIKT
jgi:hypothetical protein